MFGTTSVFMDDVENINQSSKKNLTTIKKAVNSEDSEIRLRAYCKLKLFIFNDDTLQLLRQGLTDQDEIVRSGCVEILAEQGLFANLDLLIHALDDSSYYVINSVIECLHNLDVDSAQNKAIEVLNDKLNSNHLHSSSVIAIHYALYRLDSGYSIDHLLDCLIDSEDYRNRCGVLNMLCDFCHDQDITHILTRIQCLIKPTDFDRVISDFNDLIQALKRRQQNENK